MATRPAPLTEVAGYAQLMVSRLAAGIALALLTAACNTGSGEEPDPTATSSEVEPTTTTTEAPDVGSVGAGRLAVIDLDGNVVVVSPDGSGAIEITFDAGDAAYSQPIWSPDSSRLAFGRVSATGFEIVIEEVDGDAELAIPVSNNPFYMYWSPDGATMGVLHNGTRGLDFEIVDVSEGTSAVIDQGTPFYFSWSPEGNRVVIHEGMDRFEVLDMDGGREDLGETGANYLAPQWMPGGILHVTDDNLVIDQEPGDRTILARVSEQTMFVANPQGTLVAVQSLGQGGTRSVATDDVGIVELNAVSVIDVPSGEIEVVDRSPSVGFWWSPDGESLLTLSPTGQGGLVTARVWSAADGLRDFATYRPSPIQVRDLFPFFPQYAQSMTFWAPDSSGFALVGDIDGEIGVWVQDVSATVPQLVARGVWVAWSNS